ncbi:hypothetical protein MRX96_029847 [Rhipicephalus microplus]
MDTLSIYTTVPTGNLCHCCTNIAVMKTAGANTASGAKENRSTLKHFYTGDELCRGWRCFFLPTSARHLGLLGRFCVVVQRSLLEAIYIADMGSGNCLQARHRPTLLWFGRTYFSSSDELALLIIVDVTVADDGLCVCLALFGNGAQ